LLSIENITGGAGNDIIGGDASANVIQGGDGNDTLKFSEGNSTGTTAIGDTLNGGVGIDTADYTGASGINVTLSGGAGQVEVFVGGSVKQYDQLIGIENIIGSGSQNNITGDTAANKITGGGSSDTLAGGDGNDTLDGGAGNDILQGGNNDDSLIGGNGKDTLLGGEGNDILIGGAGSDSLVGGNGIDTADYSASGAAVTVDLTNIVLANVPANDGIGDVIGTDVEIIIGSGYADTFTGRAAAETIQGGNGNDTIIGSDGADSIDGGDGIDVVDYSSSSTAVTIDLTTAGTAQTGGYAAGDILTLIEKIIGTTGTDKMTAGNTIAMTFDGQAGNDTLIGGSLGDSLIGGDGNDSLTGNDGNDTLEAGTGSDYLNAGAGDDILDFRTGNSDATLAGDTGLGGAGNDIFKVNQSQLSNTSNLDGGADTDTLQFYATTTGAVNLSSIVGITNIEKLDFSQDSFNTNSLVLSAASINSLVGAGNGSTLYIHLDSGANISLASGSSITSLNATGGSISDGGSINASYQFY
jgi:Ca2+-binding RTX toxin-like protein